jgi:hypothetical protein
MCTKTSFFESGRNPSSMDTRLVQNLAISDGSGNDRYTNNALLIENNLHAYLGQWLSDSQILALMCDTTPGVKLVKKKHGGTTAKSDGNARTIEIYERSSLKMHAQIALHIHRNCLFGNWRLSPEAKWVEHGIVVHGIFPEIVLASMATVGDIIQHPSLDLSATITKVKPADKTTRFSAAVKVTTRSEMVRLAAQCPGNGPYTYRHI